MKINVSPLPGDGQPDDYAGVISHGLELKEFCDILEVETNDVITITYRLKADGYVPKNYNPQGVDFEWGRSTGNSGEQYVEYRRFLWPTDGRLLRRFQFPIMTVKARNMCAPKRAELK